MEGNNIIKKILLITIDCLRADHVGYNGYPRNITPTLDMMAKEGSNFFNAFSNGPHTHYSFPSILTSNYPLMFNGPKLGFERVTLAEYLKRMGFKTIGLNSNPFLSEYFGYGKGFDVFNDFLDSVKGRNNFAIKLRKYLSKENPIYRMIQLMNSYLSIKKTEKPFIIAEELTKNILNHLEANKKDKLFIWAHFMDAHYPYLPNKSNIEKLGFEDIPDIKKTFLFLKMLNNPKKVTKREIKILKNLYDAQIYNIDKEIKKIYSYLENNSLLDETLVVITADHGEEFREHGDFSHRVDKDEPKLYDIHLHVPLIFYCKNKLFYDVNSCVSLLDLTPTIIDILGIKKLDEFKGKSLLPLMEKKERQKDRSFFVEHEYQKEEIVGNILKKRKKAIGYRDSPYKLIFYEGDGRYRLYDIENDPLEKNDLAKSSRYETVLLHLQKKIKKHLKEIEESKIKLKIQTLRGI